MKTLFDRVVYVLMLVMSVVLMTLLVDRPAHSAAPSLDRVYTGFVVYPGSAVTTVAAVTGSTTCSVQLTAGTYYEVQTTGAVHCLQGATGLTASTTTSKPFYNTPSYFMYVGNATTEGFLCCIADSVSQTVSISPLAFQ